MEIASTLGRQINDWVEHGCFLRPNVCFWDNWVQALTSVLRALSLLAASGAGSGPPGSGINIAEICRSDKRSLTMMAYRS